MWRVLIFPIFILFFLKNYFKIIINRFIIIFLLLLKKFSENFFSSKLVLETINILLIVLSLYIVLYISIICSKKKELWVLLLRLIIFFSSKNIIRFYIFFELSIFPAFYMIFKYGKKPERIRALKAIIIYTIVGSFPLIFVFLKNFDLKFVEKFLLVQKKIFLINLETIIIFFVLAFFIKLPLFGFHNWLPKAHVEAPTAGSMILAALLLKMGSFGLYRFSFGKIKDWVSNIISSWILVCLIVVRLMCFLISDLKVLIAYSSVNHMLLVGFRWIFLRKKSLFYSLILRLSHGFIRRGLFLLVGKIYKKTNSRKIFFNQRINKMFSLIKVFWFLLLVLNCSTPPSLSIFSEIVLFRHLNEKMFRVLRIIFFVFFSGLYCIFLYIKTFHGKKNIVKKNFKVELKFCFSAFIHIIPALFSFFILIKIF